MSKALFNIDRFQAKRRSITIVVLQPLEVVLRQVLSKVEGIKICDNKELEFIANDDDVTIAMENEKSLKNPQKIQ